ncbi:MULTISPECIES: hypothetical protein [unclassified Brenneria]|uniref:hypothetical protein n=1 Tax=unclassified Brenneria TaxID=2634434 RepID=UPI001552200C|nr:hypothetical protein [Brenneria sp. hezel4-2-4]MEE3652902.1 hypothetical protein [Brenneria sp. HEZEL_4_2_4]NPD02856.1 hypothetical protein [Brenneria sp. hezel4-2-4]
MAEFYVLIQEQLTTISTILIIGLTAWFGVELNSSFRLLWKKPQALRGKIVHRAYLPARKTLTLIDNFYGYVPVHVMESERFILDVEANGKRYQVETTAAEYRALSIGDSVVIHHHADETI